MGHQHVQAMKNQLLPQNLYCSQLFLNSSPSSQNHVYVISVACSIDLSQSLISLLGIYGIWIFRYTVGNALPHRYAEVPVDF